MYIKQVKIKNFKNFMHKEIDLEKGLNIIVGGHATGKSTIIDAIRFVIDPQFENNSENLNLHGFKYKPPSTATQKTGYVELLFFCRNLDCQVINVRRDFSNLDLVIIDKRREMKIRQFYIYLISRNFYSNSFMSSFIDSEMLYNFDNNGIFKYLRFFTTELIMLHEDIRNLVTSSNNILTNHLIKLSDFSKNQLSTVSDNKPELIKHLKSLAHWDKFMYNMTKQSNIHRFLKHRSDKLRCLVEMHDLFDVHEMGINMMVELTNSIESRAKSSNFVSLNKQFVQNIEPLLTMLQEKIKELSTDLINFESYPMQLDAQQQIYKYVNNLRSSLKMKSLITRSIAADIELLNEVISRKLSTRTKLFQSIESHVTDFDRLTSVFESCSIVPDTKDDDTATQPINFFLNDRLSYYKMKLILNYNFHPTIMDDLILALTTFIQEDRIKPVFACIKFKEGFIIKQYFYDYLAPILNWIIVNESSGIPFDIPEQLKSCNVTWVPTRQLYFSSELILDPEFQYIWEGVDFETLCEKEILTEHEIGVLKFIFYQQQLNIQYESTLLLGGIPGHCYDVKDLCSSLQMLYRLLIYENELKFCNVCQTDIPIQFFKYREHLDSIISSTKNIKNDFKLLLEIAEQLQYHEEDVNLKTMCLNQFNSDTEFYLVLKDFDLPRYKSNVENIDKIKITIEQLEKMGSQLNFNFNKLFLQVYLPLEDMVVIVPNSELRFSNWSDWNNFIIKIQSELKYTTMVSDENLLELTSLGVSLRELKKNVVTDYEETCLFKCYESKISNINSSITSFCQLICESTESVTFLKNAFSEYKRAKKTLQKVSHSTMINDVFASVNIQVYDQVNNSIDVANQLLGNFNYSIKLSFDDWVNEFRETNMEDNKLTSFRYIIQKKANQYDEQSSMESFITEYPARSDINLAKLMFILGVSLHNKHKLLTFDDMSVVLNKNPGLLTNLLQSEDIYREQQIIITYNPSEIISRDKQKINDYLLRAAELDGINFINLNI